MMNMCVLFAGEEQWGGQCRNGRRQSPIDLAKGAAVMGIYPSLHFRNYENSLEKAKIRNTGHSCEFDFYFCIDLFILRFIIFYHNSMLCVRQWFYTDNNAFESSKLIYIDDEC